MGLAVGLAAGAGLLLIWLALTAPGAPKPRRRGGPSRVRELLARAGLEQTTPAGLFVVCAVSAVVAFLAVQVLSGTATVAAAFGLLAAYLPVALVTGRARRRQRELLDGWP